MAICVLLIAITQMTFALQINIKIKPNFNLNDQIDFNYLILSEKSEEIEIFVGVNCPKMPKAPLIKQPILLEANNPVTKTYSYVRINEDIEPQTCEAFVLTNDPLNTSKIEKFTISTAEAIQIELNSCFNQDCTQKSKIFTKGNSVFLDFNSDPNNPTIKATLKFPDKTIQEISLPHSFTAEQLGTYNLVVKASKEGYRDSEQTTQFGVIEKEPEINEAREKQEIPLLLKTCENAECGTIPNEFLPGETAYLDYSSVVEGIQVKAKITLPDGTTKILSLPASIQLEQKGTYIIEATAEKTGWKKTTKIATIEVREPETSKETQPIDPILLIGGIGASILVILIIVIWKFKNN